MTGGTVAVLLLAGWAAVLDLRRRTIPRWLTVPAAGLGLAGHAIAGGFLSSLAAMLLGLGLGLALLQVNAFGGGDAKWLAATGALLGLGTWIWAVLFAMLAAGLTALGQLAWRGRLGFVFADCGAIVRGWVKNGWRADPAHGL